MGDKISSGGIIENRSHFDDINTAIVDVATERHLVDGGLLFVTNFGAKSKARVVATFLVFARNEDAIMLVIGCSKDEADIGEAIDEVEAIIELEL